MMRVFLLFLAVLATSEALAPPRGPKKALQSTQTDESMMDRRSAFASLFLVATPLVVGTPTPAFAEEESMFAPKFVQEYADFDESPNGGWRFRNVNPGKGSTVAEKGDRVVFDWSGYTIGYFGRPFQAKGGPQGGAFDKEVDYSRTVLGSNTMVKGVEEALEGMKVGGVRQVVIPYGPLSYPPGDPTHDKVGPKPTTFSGQRALNFVLDNPRVDRTMLFNVKVVRIDKPNGKGGFLRGSEQA